MPDIIGPIQYYITYGTDDKSPLGKFLRTPPGRNGKEAINYLIETFNRLGDLKWFSLSRFRNNVRKPQNWQGACGICVKVIYESEDEKPNEVAEGRLLQLIANGQIPAAGFYRKVSESGIYLFVVYHAETTDAETHRLATANYIGNMSGVLIHHGLGPGSFPKAGGYIVDLFLPEQFKK